MQSSKNSDLHNSNQKLVLHMWEDEHHENEARKHRDHKHHHRNRHKHHSRDHKDHISEDRIDVYVAKRNLKGPPTKPKPNLVEYARKSHSSLHSKQPFLRVTKYNIWQKSQKF